MDSLAVNCLHVAIWRLRRLRLPRARRRLAALARPSAVPAPPAVPTATLEVSEPLQRSPAVRRLQEALNRQGAGIDVDGVYGRQTARAVAALQSRTARPVDGRVTLELWALLFRTE